jgi:hypothetical protein
VRVAWVDLAVVAGGLFIAYLPAVATTYAYTDDYSHLGVWHGAAAGKWADAIKLSVEQGRPLAGLITEGLFYLASSISDLWFVRLFSITGIILLGFAFHWALVRAGLGRRSAVLAVVLLLTLPAYQVYAAWAVLATAPYAALLGFIGGVIATDALVGHKGGQLAMRLALAAVVLLAALLMYQPAAMMFWVSVAVALVVPRVVSQPWRILGGCLVVAAVAAALAYVALELSLAISGWDASSRSALIEHPGSKASWLLYIAMPRALGLHYLGQYPSGALGLAVASVILLGLALRARGDPKCAIRLGLAAAALVPLAYAPSLVVEENWATFRTQIALSTLIGLYFVVSVIEIGRFTLERLGGAGPRVLRSARLVTTTTAVAGVVLAIVAAHANLRHRFIRPETQELEMIRSQLAAIPGRTVSRVVFRLAASSSNGDEFGFPSSAASWVAEPVVALVLREQGRLGRTLSVKVIPPWAPVPEGASVVDMASFEG